MPHGHNRTKMKTASVRVGSACASDVPNALASHPEREAQCGDEARATLPAGAILRVGRAGKGAGQTGLIPGNLFPRRALRQRVAHVLALVLCGTPRSHAQALDVRALAATCATCHQVGQRVPPPLAGQPRDELIAKLRGFRDGTRSGTVMPQLANGYTPAELDALAGHFARRSPSR